MTRAAAPWHRRRRGLTLVAVPALACMSGVVLVMVELSFRLTNPPGYVHPGPTSGLTPTGSGVSTNPLVDFGFEYQDVSFPTAGQATLRGWFVPGSGTTRVGVVTAHGRGGDRRDFLRHLPVFHQLGLPTLLFDYREHGTSDGNGRGMSMGHHEAEDISAAVRYMKQTIGLERVVVVGVSLGASSAILAAAQDQAIDAVVAESPFASMDLFLHEDVSRAVSHRPVLRDVLRPGWWPGPVVQFTAWRKGITGLQAPIDVVDRIAPRPLLLIHGTADRSVSWTHSESLYAKAAMPKDLWLVDSAEHTRVFDRCPKLYYARLSTFIPDISR